eukprot:Phypoly_transcript_23397.p1 GENE.Phypoly_transcript_23397~~Phypoly_transcript_23397.p1  ORF type:complete len:174 (+),score=18.72 Phypoly_transcript_23397:74-523(+)
MTQFWEGYIKDRKSTTPVPLATLQDEIFEYDLRLSFKMNKILATGPGWDGAVYRTLELAATYITEDEIKERELRESKKEDQWEPDPTDRFQPMFCGKHTPWHGKFDHKKPDNMNEFNILQDLPGGTKIAVNESKIMQNLLDATNSQNVA